MPRASSFVRHRFFLPAATLAELQSRAEVEHTPVAELIRRIADLAITFNVPAQHAKIPSASSAPQPFVAFIPQPMLDELADISSHYAMPVDELIRRAAYVWLRQRNLVTHRAA
jgi:3-polyprenyl-4-hydroxybenzoate decarboxylase